jgi:release factor glutamine methyltransferase
MPSRTPAPPTIQALIVAARQRLRQKGIDADEAALDARLLAQHALGWDATRLLTAGGEPIPPTFAAAFEALVARREAREPLAYITGVQHFWDRTFEVSPSVLIPRPETELLVEIALDVVPVGTPALIADVCTGSGCVAIAIACERPNARIVATDLSSHALDVARRNAVRNGVGERIEFAHGDLLEEAEELFDLIVANPPYVPERDRAALQPEVRDFEPPLALFAGPDGLALIERLVQTSIRRLAPGGTLAFEIGAGQSDDVARLISQTPGLRMLAMKHDLQDIPRAVVAVRDARRIPDGRR